MEQLSFNFPKEQEISKYSYDSYDWLTGNPDNLIEFFKKELSTADLKPELKIDAERRLSTLAREHDV